MSRSVSRRSMVIAGVFSLVMCVLMWRMTQSPMQKPHYPIKKSVPVLTSLSQEDREDIITTAPAGLTGNPADTISATGWDVEHKETKLLPRVPDYDAMPFQKHLMSREELQKTEWVSTLHKFLQTLDKSVSPHVNLVFGDDDHRHLVLNWITAALMVLEPPLHNVMVLSLDHSLCDFLTTRKLPLTCIAVPVESVLILNLRGKSNQWSLGLMVRLPVLRLINYWGYDVAAYDSDAVLLRNPQVLFTERPNMDVFSAAGTFPHDVSKQWGFTLCAGTIILRATPAVEALWSHISAISLRDDQMCLNRALVDMGVVWRETTNVSSICSVRSGWECEGAINIFVFPQEQFCRGCCKPKKAHTTLYLVHPNSDKRNLKTKKDVLKKMRAWFLE